MKITRRNYLLGTAAIVSCRGPILEPAFDEEEMYISRPVILHSEAEVNAGSDSEVSASPLMNSVGEPIEVLEIKFSIRQTNKELGAAFDSELIEFTPRAISGGQIAVGFTVKTQDESGYALTNGPIPIWSFGPSKFLGSEINPFVLSGGFQGEDSLVAGVANYTWKFDHPMYMPVDSRLIPVLRSLGSFVGAALVGITVKARTADPAKTVRRVPWVASYLSKSYSYNQEGAENSSANALQNPHSVPVHIERFTGRIYMSTIIQDLSGVVSNFPIVLDDDEMGISSPDSLYSRLFKVKMHDSVGNTLVRRPTLFRNVFDANSRSWETKHVLPANQFYTVNVFKSIIDGASFVEDVPSRAQVSTTLIGWRDVTWKKEA